MNIIVTGGTGYIGSHTAVELLEAGHEVTIVDNLCNSKANVVDKIEEITGKRPDFYEVDLRDAEALSRVFAEKRYDVVMHFAGLKAVAESVKEPLMYYENNVGGTLNLLQCMREFGVKKIVFSSSATVYGIQETAKYVETMTTGTRISNPYGKTKFMIEEILKDVAATDKEFSATILRYFNPIGAHKSGLIGENPNDKPNNLMPIIMKVAKREMPELTICGNDYATPDGTCVRDYIHVVDLAQGHLAAMEKMEPGVKIYNLGSGKGTSVLEMVITFSEVSGVALPHKMGPRREGDLPAFYADPTLAEKELGWKAERSVREAMEDTLKFLEKNA